MPCEKKLCLLILDDCSPALSCSPCPTSPLYIYISRPHLASQSPQLKYLRSSCPNPKNLKISAPSAAVASAIPPIKSYFTKHLASLARCGATFSLARRNAFPLSSPSPL